MDKEARRQELFDKYNKRGMENGYRLQGEYFLRTVHLLDQADPEWTEAWLAFIYDYNYGRTVLDDRTRVLVIIGECVAVGYLEQLKNHMSTAIKVGATPEEIQEVILQASIYGGMPRMRNALTHYQELMEELGLKTYEENPFFYGGDER